MPSQFDNCATEYHNFRPEYPAQIFCDLIDSFQLTKNDLIIDVGCGTGRAALPLAEHGLRLLGIDASRQMLQFAAVSANNAHLPIMLAAGLGEALPLPNQCAQFINCAQTFHWFEPQTALTEFHRILQPGGGLALYWNNRDETRASYLTDVEELIVKFNPKHQLKYRAKDWGAELAQSQKFTGIELRQYHHETQVSVDDLVGLTRSFSYVRNVLSDNELTQFEQELRALLARVAVADRLTLPYRVEAWLAMKS